MDELFPTSGIGRVWTEIISADCRQFLNDLADEIVRRGMEPSWAEVLRKVERDFPNDAPNSYNTVSRAVRELVAARG